MRSTSAASPLRDARVTPGEIDALTEFVKRPQVGAKGLIWIRVEADAVKSSVDKFYTPDEVRAVAEACGAAAGDMVFLMSGPKFRTLTQLCALRLEVAQQLGLRDPKRFAPLWVVDFPLFEWDDETQRFYAMHHPFTSPKPEDVPYLESDPGRVRANAYDFVCNGTEIGGGSIRIHDPKLQAAIFSCLGFTPEKAQEQFGFLMNAFKYGAASSRRPGLRVRPSVLAVRRLGVDPRLHRLPEEQCRPRRDARCTVGHRPCAARRVVPRAESARSEIGGWRRRSSGEKICEIRGARVMLDADRAALCGKELAGTDSQN